MDTALSRIRQFAAAIGGRNAPLRLRLVLLVGIAMLPPGILAFWQARYSYNAALITLKSNLEKSAQLVAAEQERLIKASRDILTSLAAQPGIRGGGEPCKRALTRAFEELTQYTVAAVTDAQGKVICATQSVRGNINLSDRRWFKELQQGAQFAVSDQIQGRISGDWGVITALRFNDDAGAMTGSLSAMLGAEQFVAGYRKVQLPQGATVALLNNSGDMLPNPQPVSVANSLPSAVTRDEWLRNEAKTFEARGRDGVKRVYAVNSVPDSKISVVLAVPSSAVLNPLALQFAWGIFTPLLMWVLALVVVSFGIERMVVRWINELERVTSAYAAGNRASRPQRLDTATAEIRNLGETFSRMADTIDAHEAELQESLAQKDALVREIHHRVKNNLQIVISLLNLHARRIKNPQAEIAFSEVRGRINALATLHRRLYESEHLQSIDLKWFIEDICHELRRSAPARGRNISLSTELPNEIIGPDVAVPLGLLTTEVVSNTYKYAFAGRASGRIQISGARDDQDHFSIYIVDDGIGADARNAEDDPSIGLGQSLIEAFVRQLAGELTTELDNGTRLRVRFRLPVLSKPGT